MRLAAITESKSPREFRLSFDMGGYWYNLRELLAEHGYTEGADYVINGDKQTLALGPRVQVDGELREFLERVGRAERVGMPKQDVFR